MLYNKEVTFSPQDLGGENGKVISTLVSFLYVFTYTIPNPQPNGCLVIQSSDLLCFNSYTTMLDQNGECLHSFSLTNIVSSLDTCSCISLYKKSSEKVSVSVFLCHSSVYVYFCSMCAHTHRGPGRVLNPLEMELYR